MAKYILKRLIQIPLILAVIYLITFALVWVAPGSPFEQNDRKIDEVTLKQMKDDYHADSPWKFLCWYPWRMLHGDLGISMKYPGWSVNEVIKKSLPVSIGLGMMALIVALFVGVGVGTLAAVNRGGALDYLSLAVAMIGISVPSFVVAMGLLVTFTVWFPCSWVKVGSLQSPKDFILPVLALSLIPMAFIARLTRVSMLDVLGNDYVRTALAKGLKKKTVIWKHGLKNAFLPVLSYLGPAAAATFTGSFVVEKVFEIPGLGIHFVNSVQNRDQTLILGLVMVYSLFLLTFNLLVDIGYALIDPRIDMTR
jgi:oligopeptide transport system permease protein